MQQRFATALLLIGLLVCSYGTQLATACSMTGLWQQNPTFTTVPPTTVPQTTVPQTSVIGTSQVPLTTVVSVTAEVTQPPTSIIPVTSIVQGTSVVPGPTVDGTSVAPSPVSAANDGQVINYVVQFDSPSQGTMTGASVISPSDLPSNNINSFVNTFQWDTANRQRCLVRWWGAFVMTPTGTLTSQLSLDVNSMHCTLCSDDSEFDDDNVCVNNNGINFNLNDDNIFDFNDNINWDKVLNGSACLQVPGIPSGALNWASDCAAFSAHNVAYVLNSTLAVAQPGNVAGADRILTFPDANRNNNLGSPASALTVSLLGVVSALVAAALLA